MTAVLQAKREKYAFLYPLVTVALTNTLIPIGRVTMSYVLAAWLIVGLVAYLTRTKGYIYSSLWATSAFFFITNLGVFLEGWYGYTWSGLVACFALALPFVYKQLSGNILVAFVAQLSENKIFKKKVLDKNNNMCYTGIVD
jgi:hypothetical protein